METHYTDIEILQDMHQVMIVNQKSILKSFCLFMDYVDVRASHYNQLESLKDLESSDSKLLVNQ